ncbi:hypothetical protein RF11_02944 [Thelohanellus kitauei]|uniref:BPTI/Kunitz inhibitor domain-containing protein n=1 Tax=Thelohanellus kitauei TaxID=669202 RepID=A0A0C2JUB2_THEKT|nr:hypothetical protein RF11_02944 [Thelohanellus kitauei]
MIKDEQFLNILVNKANNFNARHLLRMRFLISFLAIFEFSFKVSTVLLPKECYKPKYIGNCQSNEKTEFIYYDTKQEMCQTFKSCGPASPGQNIFQTWHDCRAECVAPSLVKDEECLIDWGEPDFSHKDKVPQFAYNKHLGWCDPYVKHEGYPTPRIFNTTDECRKFCLINVN